MIDAKFSMMLTKIKNGTSMGRLTMFMRRVSVGFIGGFRFG